jgi:hypothetical protein
LRSLNGFSELASVNLLTALENATRAGFSSPIPGEVISGVHAPHVWPYPTLLLLRRLTAAFLPEVLKACLERVRMRLAHSVRSFLTVTPLTSTLNLTTTDCRLPDSRGSSRFPIMGLADLQTVTGVWKIRTDLLLEDIYVSSYAVTRSL